VNVQTFRRETGLLFIDESGQLQAPWDGRPHEIGVVAGLLMPDTQRDRDAIAHLVSQLRQRVFGTPDCREDIKAKMLDSAAYGLIAREIRERWVVGYPSLEITQQAVNDLKSTFDVLESTVGESRRKLGNGKALDIRLDFLRRQYSTAVEQHPIYMSLLFSLYRDTARWFRKNGILPGLTVWLDDKLRRADKELHNFFGRFATWTEYPEVFGKRLGALLGIDPSADFTCNVSSDSEQDGLVIADAIAFAVSMVRRGEDHDGMYQRAMDIMNIDIPLQGGAP
jgi:hypothetical protein